MSVGRAWNHSLPDRLDQLAANHFQGIEMFYEDLEYHAKAMTGGATEVNLVRAAKEIRALCEDRKLEVIVLQPFGSYEGLIDRQEHAERIQKLHLWFELAHHLGTDMIQIPSNFMTEGITGDHETLVKDMREVADLGLKQTPPVRFVYENLCWGTFVNTWEQAWDIIAAVDRPNFGICLDTFNIAGREWADPSRADGKIPNADEVLRQSLERLRNTVDVKKVFYIQVVDGERLEKPLVSGHPWFKEDQNSRMSWSRNARCLPYEKEGYLPWMDVLKTITGSTGLGFEGWVSFELFSRTMEGADPSVPKEHAGRCALSRQKLGETMDWEVPPLQ